MLSQTVPRSSTAQALTSETSLVKLPHLRFSVGDLLPSVGLKQPGSDEPQQSKQRWQTTSLSALQEKYGHFCKKMNSLAKLNAPNHDKSSPEM